MRTRSTPRVPALTEIGFGGAQIGNLHRAIRDDTARAAVDAAWDAGIRYFDTAPHYGLGLSERRLGAALRERARSEYVISTKVGRLLVDAPESADRLDDDGFAVPATLRRQWDFSRDGIRRSVEQSLERLGLDSIDIAYLHDPDAHWDAASTTGVAALAELRDEGVIGAFGAGMNQAAMLADFVERCDVDIVMVAGRYTLLDDAVAEERWAAPIARPGKVVCIGLNYRDHAAETGAELPAEPVVFMKDPDTVVGPFDDVLIPRGSVKTDWEVELGVVIGQEARYLDSVEEAAACIAGYVLSHDVSEREFQLERGGQWDKGKSCETFNPCGPWFVPADEVADPQALRLWLKVNGETMQDGSSADMVFPVHEVVRYLSHFMVLRPGDLVNTGTPAGVGLGQRPPRYLRAGDVVELGIDGLGTARQRMVSA